MLKTHFHNVRMQNVKYLIHTICLNMFALCSFSGAVLELGTKCVMVYDSSGIHVGSLG